MNTKILPYFRSQFWRLFVILFTAPSFSVRKFVFTLFTSFDYLLNHFALLFERQLKEVRRLRRALRRARMASGLDQYGMIESYKTFNLTPVLLPNSLFMNGDLFFYSHQYSWDEVSPSLIMIHNNYIRGYECKRLRMLEMGLMKRREKDNESNLYLTAESLSFDKRAIRSQLELLISLSNQLNRILIIPPIKCRKGKGFCTICNQEGPYCYWDVLQQLKNGYRESVRMDRIIHCSHS